MVKKIEVFEFIVRTSKYPDDISEKGIAVSFHISFHAQYLRVVETVLRFNALTAHD
jgi:hypothetical protein